MENTGSQRNAACPGQKSHQFVPSAADSCWKRKHSAIAAVLHLIKWAVKYWVTRQRNEETDRTPDSASEAFQLPQSTCWEHGQPAAPPKASEASEGWNASWQCPHLSLSPPFFHVCCLGDKTDGSSFIALMAWLWCLAVDALVYSRGNKPRITPGALQSPSLHRISPEEEPIRPGFSQFCCALNTASVFKYYGAFLCSIYLMHAMLKDYCKT